MLTGVRLCLRYSRSAGSLAVRRIGKNDHAPPPFFPNNRSASRRASCEIVPGYGHDAGADFRSHPRNRRSYRESGGEHEVSGSGVGDQPSG
jgi:hypothetical protein